MSDDNRTAQEIEAEEYCLHHELERPSLHIKVALGVSLLYMKAVSALVEFLQQYYRISVMPSIDFSIFLSIPIIGRRFLIYCIQVYQHVAPEWLRRRCICKPSCSEYSIEALQKYGLLKGCYKIYIRLTKTCRGQSYIIDKP